ncbi:MAG: beta-propeller fold lactonase family protein [Caldimonas sp.]
MKHFRRHALACLFSAFVIAGLTGVATPAAAHDDDDDAPRSTLVFTSSNDAAGNHLLIYSRSPDGALGAVGRVATGGLGAGNGLGSQGAVTLSRDRRYLFVVNANSHSISTFRVGARSARLISAVDSAGLHPISVTESDGVVYVLNDGGAGNVAGFRNVRGVLHAIPGSVRGLSASGGTGPAQVGFSEEGDALVVTEKATNRITSYAVTGNGSIGAPIFTPSPGQTPFGFAFNRRNRLIVSEAWGGASGASTLSSYQFSEGAPSVPVPASVSVPDTQTAACWVAVTPDGRYAYTTNTGSSTVSSYRVRRDGSIALLDAVAGSTGRGSAPLDTASSDDGQSLFVLSGGTSTITSFRVGSDGGLSTRFVLPGLPGSAVGLAAN